LGRNESKIPSRSRKIKNKIMAKSKKTKKEEVVELKATDATIAMTQKKYDECEWCFQFDSDEPQIFAWTDSEMNKEEDPKVIFTITNIEDSFISFQHKSGKVFKLFARELTNEGKSLRDEQRELYKKANLQNESTNKEA
jgi:hypothetical protein